MHQKKPGQTLSPWTKDDLVSHVSARACFVTLRERQIITCPRPISLGTVQLPTGRFRRKLDADLRPFNAHLDQFHALHAHFGRGY